jgi:multidrug resistance efflux pump
VSEPETRSLEPGTSSSSLLSVRAPIAGEVVEKHVVIGELVTPVSKPLHRADLQHVWIWIDVYERDLANVHLKDDVEVRVEALPQASSPVR